MVETMRVAHASQYMFGDPRPSSAHDRRTASAGKTMDSDSVARFEDTSILVRRCDLQLPGQHKLKLTGCSIWFFCLASVDL